jgi:hypothetical protein
MKIWCWNISDIGLQFSAYPDCTSFTSLLQAYHGAFRFKWMRTEPFCKCYQTASIYLQIITNSMAMSPWEAASRSATSEFPRILWNPRVHYRIHKIQQLVRILRHISPVHTTLIHSTQINFCIILPYASRSSKWPLSFWPCDQNPTCIHSPYKNNHHYITPTLIK